MKNLNNNKQLQKKLLKSAKKEMRQLQEVNIGWYSVTITGIAIKIIGNNGPVTFTVKVYATSQLSAYNQAVLKLQQKPVGNVLSFISFESPIGCSYEFLGTDIKHKNNVLSK